VSSLLGTGQPPLSWRKRAGFARERAKRVEPSVSYLIIHVNQRPAVVYQDGQLVHDSRWGTKVPIDPGNHVVIAEAPGKQRFTAAAFVVEAATTIVTIPPLLDVSTPAPKASAEETSARESARGARRAAEASRVQSDPSLRRWAFVVSGTGAAALAGGLVLSLTAPDSPDGCRDACAVGTGLLIGGALVAVTGIALVLASLGDDPGRSRVSTLRPLSFSF
jgi:hypothetical protein